MKVSSPTSTDIIYSGKEDASFDVFKTDANKIFFRNPKNSTDYQCLMSGGSYLEKNGENLINISTTDSGMEISAQISQNNLLQIKKDGIPYTEFSPIKSGDAITIYSNKTNSVFEIYLKDETAYIIVPDKVPSSCPSQNPGTSGIIPNINPFVKKAGNFPLGLISGITLFILLCRYARRE